PVRRDCRLGAVALIEWREIGPIAGLEQLLEAVEHEVALLEFIDAVLGAHHAHEIEPQALGMRILETVDGLALGREDPRSIYLESLRGEYQPELDHVPIQARQHAQPARNRHRLRPGLTVRLHEAREHRNGEQWHMTEEIMKQVRLDQIVELFTPAD